MFGLRCPDCEMIISDEHVVKMIENPETEDIPIYQPVPIKTQE